MDLSQLEQIYTEYDQALRQAHKKSSIFSMIMGQGAAGDPRNDPCNREFYEKVGIWVHTFVSSAPEETNAISVCRFLMEAAAQRIHTPTYWYTLVAQGYIKELLPLLSPESRHMLAKHFDTIYPGVAGCPCRKTCIGFWRNNESSALNFSKRSFFIFRLTLLSVFLLHFLKTQLVITIKQASQQKMIFQKRGEYHGSLSPSGYYADGPPACRAALSQKRFS